MTKALIPFKFKSTGVDVALRPVSPLLSQKLSASIPKPVPPMERVLGPDGSYRDEANPSHPDHLAAMERHDAAIELATRNLYIKLGVVLTLTNEQRQELADVREYMMASQGAKLEDDDKIAYIAYCAIGSGQDYRDFIQAVTQTSQATDPKSVSGSASSTSDTAATTSSP